MVRVDFSADLKTHFWAAIRMSDLRYLMLDSGILHSGSLQWLPDTLDETLPFSGSLIPFAVFPVMTTLNVFLENDVQILSANFKAYIKCVLNFKVDGNAPSKRHGFCRVFSFDLEMLLRQNELHVPTLLLLGSF